MLELSIFMINASLQAFCDDKNVNHMNTFLKYSGKLKMPNKTCCDIKIKMYILIYYVYFYIKRKNYFLTCQDFLELRVHCILYLLLNESNSTKNYTANFKYFPNISN